MRLLVTGGAGCLGSNVIEHFLPAGVEVLSLDNYATGRRESLPTGFANLRVVDGSVVDPVLINQLFEEFRPTHVIHAAASYNDPDDWHGDVITNVNGSINVVRAAEQVGVGCFINLQTALCYGIPERVPIPVDHRLAPLTSYGISKTAGEQFLWNLDLPVISLRLANVCAPRLSIGPIPTFYQRLTAGSSCFCSDTVRDFLDISDLLRLIDLLVANPVQPGAYNVSTGEGHSIKEVFDIVANHLGITLETPVPIVPVGDDDVPSVVLDPSHTHSTLGWEAQVPFAQTVQKMLAWYDRYGVGSVHSHLRAPKEQRVD